MLAHRGLAVDAPENTMLAFELAVRAGADYVETDVHVSADGVAVIAHDPTLKRVAIGRVDRVADLSAQELRRVDLGEGQRVATLEEALHAFPRTRFNIDVKTDAATEATVEVVRRADAADRVLLTAFSDARRRCLAAMVPGVATSAGRASVLRARAASVTRNAPLLRRAVAGAHALQIPERVGRMRLLSLGLIDTAHAAGIEVHVWTVNDEPDMRRLVALGVDGIVTDRADLALRVIAEI